MHEPMFLQQRGLWERRNAPVSWINLALGVECGDIKGPQQDAMGYSIWHYWANSPNPEDSWDQVRKKVGSSQDLICAHNGEHPLHRLCLNGKHNAAQLWVKHASTPWDATMFLDTLWHCIAWSGNTSLLQTVGPHLNLDNINALDDVGVTPVMIAVHRGDVEFVKTFLFFGSDPNALDEQQRNLLHHVAQYGDISFYTEIQDFGANEDLRNERGQTPKNILTERMKHGTAQDFLTSKLYWEKRWASKLMF